MIRSISGSSRLSSKSRRCLRTHNKLRIVLSSITDEGTIVDFCRREGIQHPVLCLEAPTATFSRAGIQTGEEQCLGDGTAWRSSPVRIASSLSSLSENGESKGSLLIPSKDGMRNPETILHSQIRGTSSPINPEKSKTRSVPHFVYLLTRFLLLIQLKVLD